MRNAGELAEDYEDLENVNSVSVIDDTTVAVIELDDSNPKTFSATDWKVGMFHRLNTQENLFVLVPASSGEADDD